MKITVLQKGLMNDEEKEPITYTENEFIKVFGTYAFDEIDDIYLEDTTFNDFWACGLHVKIEE